MRNFLVYRAPSTLTVLNPLCHHFAANMILYLLSWLIADKDGFAAPATPSFPLSRRHLTNISPLRSPGVSRKLTLACIDFGRVSFERDWIQPSRIIAVLCLTRGVWIFIYPDHIQAQVDLDGLRIRKVGFQIIREPSEFDGDFLLSPLSLWNEKAYASKVTASELNVLVGPDRPPLACYVMHLFDLVSAFNSGENLLCLQLQEQHTSCESQRIPPALRQCTSTHTPCLNAPKVSRRHSGPKLLAASITTRHRHLVLATLTTIASIMSTECISRPVSRVYVLSNIPPFASQLEDNCQPSNHEKHPTL
ncbi:uncharacterized protein BDR25DRAFT_355712 [Lindgomyces ingoldianus]|uniref:Uncharacterized protein n=1 Tax=Lindgomyces ingoldianus TaxID=673940 RepID=A0ACB6QV80_9PLEO|nr:uncharacterized protein BDR25DRAFT_355712 [Lindgomyces ingoldianus]KAF2469987.1 hypothetical protein BDR25DRAFT_355712 [Lindgomyces ingoldianus]